MNKKQLEIRINIRGYAGTKSTLLQKFLDLASAMTESSYVTFHEGKGIYRFPIKSTIEYPDILLDKNFNDDVLGEAPIPIVGETYSQLDGSLLISSEEALSPNTKSLKVLSYNFNGARVNLFIGIPVTGVLDFSVEGYVKFTDLNEGYISNGGWIFGGTQIDTVTGEVSDAGTVIATLSDPLDWHKWLIRVNKVDNTCKLSIDEGTPILVQPIDSFCPGNDTTIANVDIQNIILINDSPACYIQNLKVINYSFP